MLRFPSSIMRCLFQIAASLMLVAVLVLPATSAERVIVVFDASGSMWGQIGGQSKISIARQVLRRSVGDWKALNLDVGLMAYGHRRKGDCSDIQTLIPAGPVDANRFSRAVEGIQPRGKTPLTAAVRRAAEELRYTEEKATVVLLSDGLETCNLDPCAIASELERTGVDFTAHVIGFGLGSVEDQNKLRCIAENTGGVFLPADNAEALSNAFKKVAEVAAEPVVTSITFVAVNSATGQELKGPVNWLLDSASDEVAVTTPTGRWTIADIANGAYDIRVASGSFKGQGRYEVTDNRANPIPVQLTAELPKAALTAGELVPSGAPFQVEWTGPDGAGDKIQLSSPGDVPGSGFVSEAPTSGGSPVTLNAPLDQGDYELRYYSAEFDKLLVRQKISVGEPLPTAFLKALDEVSAGAPLNVQWEGPGDNKDWVEISKPGDPANKYVSFRYIRDGNPLAMRAPAIPGDYEIRYVNGSERKIMGRRPLKVTPADMELKALRELPAGASFNVEWKGPGHNRDWIEISKPEDPANTYVSFRYVKDGNPAQMRAPATPGLYEIRYVNGSERVIMHREALNVIPADMDLKALESVPAGNPFNVEWKGPGHNRDWIEISKPGDPANKYVSFRYVRDGNPAQMRAPAEPGTYQLRYVNGSERVIMHTRVLEVPPASITLEMPDSLPGGSSFNVNWTGPGHNRDWIEISRPEDPANKYVSFRYVRDGNPAKMRAPAAPGTYEVRYIHGTERKIMHKRNLEITPAEVRLKAVETVAAGGALNVQWEGPGHNRDWIEISRPGDPANKYVSFKYVRDGNPAQMRAPAQPGTYELRYVNGSQRVIMGKRTITVSAP